MCTRGSNHTIPRGPSTSPLGAMFGRVALLLAFSASAAAQLSPWTPYDVTLERQREVTGGAHGSVDHLVPADLGQIDLGDCAVAYAAEPSFAPSEGWCLTGGKDGYHLKFWKDAAPQQNKHSEATKTVVLVDKQLADLVQEIWINALLDTHYPRAYAGGLDGTTYYFQVRSQDLDLRGQTWSPSADRPPAWLVSAASEVMGYARSQGSDPEKLRTALAKCKERLFSYYRKRSSGGA